MDAINSHLRVGNHVNAGELLGLSGGAISNDQIGNATNPTGTHFKNSPESNEIPIDGHPGVVKQQFERGWVRYGPNHVIDQPPGAGTVYMMHMP